MMKYLYNKESIILDLVYDHIVQSLLYGNASFSNKTKMLVLNATIEGLLAIKWFGNQLYSQ